MESKKAYTGIDIFRLIAAILVIANHTSPLKDISESGNFVLTSIFARLAVPFFFMTTGFFLIRDIEKNNGRLLSFVKRSALIYGAAIVICLPLQIYKNDFAVRPLLPSVIKNILFNGTLYHLWYLPASIIGGIIAWYLVRKFGYKLAFGVTVPLYLIGLFGNSYYGLTVKLPFLKALYDEIFILMDNTQNGIFFAPLFIVLGAFLFKTKDKAIKRIPAIIGFALSLTAMTAEGLVLHSKGYQLHDSMYILLPIVSFFLFSFLISFRGKRLRYARDLSLIVYIIHPVFIVAVRFVSEFIGLERIFIDNEAVMFASVTIASSVFAIVCLYIFGKLPKKQKASESQRAWIELDRSALKNNVNELRRIMPEGCKLLGIVKANGYGHGAFEITKELHALGVDAYGVATIDEGIEIRKYGAKGLILVLGYTDPSRCKDLKKYDITQTVFDLDYARALDAQGKKIKVHIAIDSGMHRLGIPATDIDAVASVYALKNLSVEGIFSHLSVSDSENKDDICYTYEQIALFDTLTDNLKAKGLPIKVRHLQASYGLLNYPEIMSDYARIGISLYGAESDYDCQNKSDITLKPVMSIKTKIVQLHSFREGSYIGYGRAYLTKRESRIAVLPIGYADGLPRCLSGNMDVIVCSKRAPIIGRICMDQLMVDVTDIPEAEVGSIVTVIGRDGDEAITAEELASKAGTITNELFSRLGRRLTII